MAESIPSLTFSDGVCVARTPTAFENSTGETMLSTQYCGFLSARASMTSPVTDEIMGQLAVIPSPADSLAILSR
jgi:hypothetical protein